MIKFLLKTGVFFAGLLVVTLVAKSLILGGVSVTNSLDSGSTLSGPVSRAIGSVSSGASLAQEGKDYKLGAVKYFDDKKWVVVHIEPVNNNADPGLVVLENINGVYQAVIGPGSSFSRSYTYVLPDDVSQYLSQQGELNG